MQLQTPVTTAKHSAQRQAAVPASNEILCDCRRPLAISWPGPFGPRSRHRMDRSHKRLTAIGDALWQLCKGDICSPSPECFFRPHLG